MNSDYSITLSKAGWEIKNASEETVVRLYQDDDAVYTLKENNLPVKMSLTSALDDELCFQGGEFTVTDKLSILSPGFYRIDRNYLNRSDKKRSVVLMFEGETTYDPSFTMIPAIHYNGNQWGSGGEPKGYTRDGKPWVFAYNRTALPSATFSEDEHTSLGLFVDDGERNSLISSCSLEKTTKGVIHRLFWPDREEPLTYSGRDEYSPATTPEVKIEAKGAFQVSFYLSVSEVDHKNFGWTKTFDRALTIFKRSITCPMSNEQFKELRISHLKEVLFTKRGPYSLFEMGLMPVDGKFQVRQDTRYEVGWCGQNISQALALIHDYKNNKNETSLQVALDVLDTWSQYGVLDTGLFRAYFDDVIDETEEFPVDTCNLGWGMWMMLEAYQVLKEINIDKPAYFKMSIDACDFFVKYKADDGSFGKTWTLDGQCDDAGGTVGCFVLLGLMKAYELTGQKEYLDCTKEMFDFYVKRDLNQMECTAGALDTHCIDKETCWPLCKIGLDLYDLTKEQRYLDDAIRAGYYMLTFMFHYDAIYEPDSDFELYGYRTYGGTSVSTQHVHLDPWGSLITYDYYRLYRHTKDENWLTRCEAIWKNAMLGIADGKQEMQGIVRPASTQNEGFVNCRWFPRFSFVPGMMEKVGNFNAWLIAWPGAFKLLTMIRADNDQSTIWDDINM